MGNDVSTRGGGGRGASGGACGTPSRRLGHSQPNQQQGHGQGQGHAHGPHWMGGGGSGVQHSASGPLPTTSVVQKSPAERLANVEKLVFSEIEIPETGGLLGYGASARVLKGMWKKTPVAVKRFFDLVYQEEFINEVLMTSSLRHQNIAPFIGYVPEPMCIVTQYYSKGSLFDVLHVKQPQIPLSRHILIKIAKDIARGMIYLHSKGLVHRDLKPGNLLINSLSLEDVVSCVITDFGITREQSPLMTAGQGTPIYSAPEVFQGKRELHYSKKVDVFSFGIILWELWARQVPFQAVTEPVVDVIGRGERPIVPSDWLPEYVSLMTDCWAQSPDNRPLFEEVLQRLEEQIEPELGPPVEQAPLSAPSPASDAWITSQPRTRGEEVGGHRKSAFASNTALASSITAQNSALLTSSLGSLGTSSAPITGVQYVASPNSSSNDLSSLAAGLGSGPRTAADSAMEDASKIIPGDKLEWDDFVSAVQYKYNAPESSINALKFLVEEQGLAIKKKLVEILKWFSPLIPETAAVYQTAYQSDVSLYQEALSPAGDVDIPTVAEAETGYTISEIAAIVSEEWFHGFISSGESTARLAQQGTGTFLIRFSGSKPGAYALSLQNGTRDPKTVIHWLITPEPKKKFKVFHRVYGSLHEIVETHQEEPLKLQDGKNAALFATPLPKR